MISEIKKILANLLSNYLNRQRENGKEMVRCNRKIIVRCEFKIVICTTPTYTYKHLTLLWPLTLQYTEISKKSSIKSKLIHLSIVSIGSDTIFHKKWKSNTDFLMISNEFR